ESGLLSSVLLVWECSSTPRERRLADRVRLAALIAAEPERLEQLLRLAEQLGGHQLTDADHLVAVVGIGDHVHVLREGVEHREVVRREAAEPAGAAFTEEPAGT